MTNKLMNIAAAVVIVLVMAAYLNGILYGAHVVADWIDSPMRFFAAAGIWAVVMLCTWGPLYVLWRLRHIPPGERPTLRVVDRGTEKEQSHG